MAYQGFSKKLELAKAITRARAPDRTPVSHAEKVRRKQAAKQRTDKLLAENLAQRALIQSKQR
jgi:hypothetical protein